MKRGRNIDAIVLVVLCVIGALLGRIQSSARDRGEYDIVSRTIGKVVNPAARVLGEATDGVGDFVIGIFQARSLRARVKHFEDEQRVFALYDQRVEELDREIEELRALNGIGRRFGQTRLPTEIIGYTPRENRVTLSIGTASGVATGMPAISSQGLLGIVTIVSANTCQISLLGSPNLTIGAMVARKPPAVGLLQGTGGNSMSIEFNDPKTEIKAGDLVLTSGFSEKIPRGIIVGRVLNVEDFPEMGQRRANVFPSANLAGVHEVVILK